MLSDSSCIIVQATESREGNLRTTEARIVPETHGLAHVGGCRTCRFLAGSLLLSLAGCVLLGWRVESEVLRKNARTPLPAAVANRIERGIRKPKPLAEPRSTALNAPSTDFVSAQAGSFAASARREALKPPATAGDVPTKTAAVEEDPGPPPAIPATSSTAAPHTDRLRAQLDDVELKRRAAERLLATLRLERTSAKAVAVPEREVVAAFYDDPETAGLTEGLTAARDEYQAARRKARNANDVSVTVWKRRVQDLQAALAQRWRKRAPEIQRVHENRVRTAKDNLIRKVEVELSAYRTEENELREQLDAPLTAPEVCQPAAPPIQTGRTWSLLRKQTENSPPQTRGSDSRSISEN